MSARAEITAKYARAYRSASKRDKGRLLDEVVAVTGWSRDNARHLPARSRRTEAVFAVRQGSAKATAAPAVS